MGITTSLLTAPTLTTVELEAPTTTTVLLTGKRILPSELDELDELEDDSLLTPD